MYDAYMLKYNAHKQGYCAALSECVFIITIEQPPETVKTVDDLTVAITGAELVPRPGTIDVGVRTDMIFLSSDELILRMSTPPTLQAAVLIGKTHCV